MNLSILENIPLILASGSARRKEIFEAHGLQPVVMPTDVDETLPEGIAPQDAVMYLALKKGLACERLLKQNTQTETEESIAASGQVSLPEHEHALIVSADTIVYAKDITTSDWTIMGKPKDADDAWRMLKSITSEKHKVMTGVAIIGYLPDSESGTGVRPVKRVFYDSTDVFVDPMTDDEIRDYIASGEPFGKAGGYAIQMEFGKNVDHIEGDFENVVGFPFNHFEEEINMLY